MEEKLLSDQIKYTGNNEGFSDTTYFDTLKNLSTGWGYNISGRGIPPDWIPYIQDQLKNIKFPKEILEAQFKTDIGYFLTKLSNNFPWFNDLSNARKMVLIDMCYNMGWNKFNGFTKMLEAIALKNYDLASKEILNSEYASYLHKLRSKRAIVNSIIMMTDDSSKALSKLN